MDGWRLTLTNLITGVIIIGTIKLFGWPGMALLILFIAIVELLLWWKRRAVLSKKSFLELL
jgi:hypothetical protein